MYNINENIIKEEEERLRLYKEKVQKMENIERAYKKILSAKKSILREESVENKFKEIERELKIIEKTKLEIENIDKIFDKINKKLN